jgi:hypothetical protein
MKPRIVFLIMSAIGKPALIDRLAFALAPHLVLVHHDFSQTPAFHLTAPNVMFVPNPKRTGWAVFGFVDGIFHSMRYALEHLDFEYLQLLSPTCLPIKPLQEFEAHVAGPAEAHFDAIDLLRDRDALMSVGYRAFTPQGSLRFRVLRRLSNAYYETSSGRRDEAGVWLRTGGGRTLLSRIALASANAFSWPSIGRHIFDDAFRPYYGSTWFGAKRRVIAGMVDVFQAPGVRDYFSRLCIADEFVIPTLLTHVGGRKGPMNHFVQPFNGAHPGEISEEQFEQLRRSTAYFARKFPADPAAPVYSWVLRELAGADAVPGVLSRDQEAGTTPVLEPVQARLSTSSGIDHVPAPVTSRLPEDIEKDPIAPRGARWEPTGTPAT